MYLSSQAHEDGLFDEAPEPHFPVAADPLNRNNDDLELSSAVEKATFQVPHRLERNWRRDQELAREGNRARSVSATGRSSLLLAGAEAGAGLGLSNRAVRSLSDSVAPGTPKSGGGI